MKVKMLKTTYDSHYGFLDAGQEYTVNDIVGERWVSKKIATEVKNSGRSPVKTNTKRPTVKKELARVEEKATVETPPPEEETTITETYDGPEFEEMTVRELRELAKAENVAGVYGKNKAELISVLRGD